MTVYVDDMRANFGRMIMCHMMADSLEELHDMAEKIGMKRKWFQNHPKYPHYDVSLTRRKLAIEYGAQEITSKDLVKMMRRRKDGNKK
jgi:hypothetical protein